MANSSSNSISADDQQSVDIPLLEEILLPFPANFLLDMRRVCHSWKATLSSVIFAKYHALYQSSLSTLKCVLFLEDSATFFQFLGYGDSDNLVRRRHIKNFGIHYNTLNSTCNGLVFMVSKPRNGDQDSEKHNKNGNLNLEYDFSYIVHNPLLGPHDIIEVPHPRDLRLGRNTYKECSFHFGFGYLACKDDYFILAINLPCDYEIEFHVYSLRENQWDTFTGSLLVGNVHSPLLFSGQCNWLGRAGTLVNESLHWVMSGDNKDDYYVLAFDLATPELAKLFTLPPFLEGKNGTLIDSNLCCLDGCLCAWADIAEEDVVEIWIMRDYGISWTKLYCFETDGFQCWEFFGHNNTGQILVQVLDKDVEDQLILADFSSGSPEFSNVILNSTCTLADYVPTLVSVLLIISDAKDN